MLDTAARLFYARGVHEVGMDELVRETGLSKPTVYRLYPTKDQLVGAYLDRLRVTILGLIDTDRDRLDPAGALHALLDAVGRDVRRRGFRGCPFNNASIEYHDREHPARRVARAYRRELRGRLTAVAAGLLPVDQAKVLADRLATLIDGAYTSAAHLGARGPAAAGLTLGHDLVDAAATEGAR